MINANECKALVTKWMIADKMRDNAVKDLIRTARLEKEYGVDQTLLKQKIIEDIISANNRFNELTTDIFIEHNKDINSVIDIVDLIRESE